MFADLQQVSFWGNSFVLFEMRKHAGGHCAVLRQVRASDVRGATGDDEQRELSCAGGVGKLAPGAPARAYAGFWLRFVAYLIDAIVLGIFAVPILIGAAMLLGLGTISDRYPPSSRSIRQRLSARDRGLHCVVRLDRHRGNVAVPRVAGKLGVAGYAGQEDHGAGSHRPDRSKSHVWPRDGRHFAKLITGLIPLGIGYILAGFTEKRQALHDMLASCLVLRKT